MSTITSLGPSARNPSQPQDAIFVPSSASTAKVQASSATCGVGPAARRGKSLVRCCPGGSRFGSDRDCLPLNPRVIMLCSYSLADLQESHLAARVLAGSRFQHLR